MCVNIPWSQAGFCLWRKSRNEPQTKPILCSVLLCSLSFPKSRKADLRFLRFKLSLNPASAPSLPAARRGSAPDPWAWASCPQALSWPLQLDEDTPGRKVATRAGQEEANSAQNLSSNTTSSSDKNLCSSKDSWSLKPSWTQNPKDRDPLHWNLGSFFPEAPFSSFNLRKKGLQIQDNPRKLCSWSPLGKCWGKPGSLPQKPGVSPLFSENRKYLSKASHSHYPHLKLFISSPEK